MTAANKTTQELIEQGQGLVYSLASKIHRTLPVRIELEDLVAYGELGLAEAARDFDPACGTKFTTFAYYRVRGAIYDGMSKMSWTSRARYRRLRYEQMANATLAEAAGAPTTDLSSESQWLGDLSERLAIVFLNTQGEDGRGIRDSSIEDPGAAAPTAIAASREISQKLRDLIDTLPHVERRLIKETYFEGRTLQEAADRIGISKSWASRMHAKILDTLGRKLRQMGAS